METAKVDIRKLQLLNDRINQVIDALHQVRLSVHALQQGQQTQQQNPFFSQSFNPYQPYPQWQQGVGQGMNPMNPMTQPFGQSFGQQPFGQNFGQQPFGQNFGQQPFGQGFGQGINPLLAQTQSTGMTGATPGLLHTTGSPWGGQGLSHTSEQEFYNRPIFSDPLLAGRITSTFPYIHYAVPPVVTLY